MNREYRTEIFNGRRGFLIFFSFLLLIMALLSFISISLKMPMIGVVGFICLCTLPFAFEKKIKLLFTKKAFLQFDSLSLSITTYHSNDETVASRFTLLWTEIKSYKIYFSPAKNTILTIYLRDGSNKTFGFKDNKTTDEAINTTSVFSIFHFYVMQHNTINTETNKKIALTPGFLATGSGTIILFFTIALIMIAFIIHLTKQPQSSFLTLLIGISIIIQQFIKRKQESLLYKRISKLESIN